MRAAAAVVLLLIAASPWPLGSERPPWEFAISLGVLSLALLWAAHVLVTRRLVYRTDPVSVCLLGLILLTAVQLVPLPASVVAVVSPTAADWHRTLIPETPELLPGEDESAVSRRPGWLRLSVSPALTEDFLVRLLAVFLVYAAVRNFVATGDSFRRLAWVGFGTGVCLALLGAAQLLAAERVRTPFWPDAGGTGFGPFRNKNHFAFQLNLFAGLGVGLFLRAARREGAWSPQALGAAAGVGLMLAAVAFSQSRGGVVSAAVAVVVTLAVGRWAGRRETDRELRQAGLALVIGAGLVAFGLVAVFGWRVVTDRLATLWNGAAEDRASGWRAVWPLVESFPVTGVGGGALRRAEPAVRTRSEWGGIEFNTLDNDYLEALVEGGPVRLALTIGLAVAAVGGAAASYRLNRSRSLGALSLGCVFGLSAVAVHSAGDYGLHMPSVALAAAVMAAHAAGARRRDERPQEPTATGSRAAVLAGLIVLVGVVVALAEWRTYRVEQLRVAAQSALRSSDPNRRDLAVRYFEAATRVRPNDPTLWVGLSAVHLGEAGERWRAASAAVAGPAALVGPADVYAGTDPDGRVSAALRAARVGRNLNPLSAGPHLVLASYGGLFARSEPPEVHLGRAKRVAAYDPEVWYLSGWVAADRGDWGGAVADWRESLARSPRRLGPIVRRLQDRLPPERIRAEVLPDDPEVWHAAAPFLFPSGTDLARREWLRVVASRWASGPEPATPQRFAAWGGVLEELGDGPASLAVARRAAERFPDDFATRDRLASRLEAEELYEEAVPVLEWLQSRRPENRDLIDRLAAAKHALKLKADIDRP